jgi:surface protein
LASYSNNFFITPAKNNYAKYGTQLSASIPDGEVYGQITIADATYNIPAVISGIAKKYELIDEPLTPAPIVTYRGITLEKGKDYTVSYSNNDVEGTATITVAGKGNYFGSKDIEFTVYTTEYHLIGTAQQLKDYATMVNSGATYASGKLIADIDLAGDDDNQWTPIGTTSNKFNGIFDGQGYTIKNLYYKQQVENIGLFGFTTNDAYIKNVRVEGMIDITNPGGSNSGGKNCTAGGIVGNATGGVILNCSFSGTVASYSHTGGIVGQSGNTVIVNCYNEGTVIAPSNKLQELGGIVGAGGGTRINCYNVGDVKNTVSGGVVIYPIANSAINCYYRNGCCQSSSSAGWSNGNVGGGTAMSADDMKSESFISTLNANVASLRATYPDICEWKLNSDGYPVHANRKVIEMTPYAIWCEGNKTLYFDYIAQELAAGDTYDGQIITAVWSGEDVTKHHAWKTPPAWSEYSTPTDYVVFKEGFSALRPTSLSYWFERFKMYEIISIENLNTSQVTDMSHMFDGCTSLRNLDVSGFNTSQVTDMSYMFHACERLHSLDVSGFDTQNVTTMDNMFDDCLCLESIDVSGFNTSQVTDMDGMFGSCESLESIDVSGFNTSQVTKMDDMFQHCKKLTSIDLSHFDTSQVTDMDFMFYNCQNLKTIYVGDLWTTSKVSLGGNMFYNCVSLVGGDGTLYDENYTNKTKAYAGDGGYLTYSPAYLVGDANGNGEVEIGDVTSVLTLMATPEANGYNNKAADANGNGEIEIGDVTTILTIMANGGK